MGDLPSLPFPKRCPRTLRLINQMRGIHPIQLSSATDPCLLLLILDAGGTSERVFCTPSAARSTFGSDALLASPWLRICRSFPEFFATRVLAGIATVNDPSLPNVIPQYDPASSAASTRIDSPWMLGLGIGYRIGYSEQDCSGSGEHNLTPRATMQAFRNGLRGSSADSTDGNRSRYVPSSVYSGNGQIEDSPLVSQNPNFMSGALRGPFEEQPTPRGPPVQVHKVDLVG